MLILEESEYDYNPDDPTQLGKFARVMLHGKGYDRWYDKSFNIIVMKNGRVGDLFAPVRSLRRNSRY